MSKIVHFPTLYVPEPDQVEPVFRFEVRQSINRLGASRDHTVLYWPEDDTVVAQVIQNFGPESEEHILRNLHRLKLVYGAGPLSLEEYLLRASRRQRRA